MTYWRKSFADSMYERYERFVNDTLNRIARSHMNTCGECKRIGTTECPALQSRCPTDPCCLKFESKELPKLLNCPFCGGVPRLITKNGTYQITCTWCGVSTPVALVRMDDAIDQWNLRNGNKLKEEAKGEAPHVLLDRYYTQLCRILQCLDEGGGVCVWRRDEWDEELEHSRTLLRETGSACNWEKRPEFGFHLKTGDK
jgi:transcription elongation factor Elf1